MDSLKDAILSALQSRKLIIKVEPGEVQSEDDAVSKIEDMEEKYPEETPVEEGDEESVLKAMMGGDDEEKALNEMEGRRPKSLGERAKLEGAKRMQAMKIKKAV